MELGFTSFEYTGNNCPNFTGIRDHGPKLTMDFDRETADKFHLYCEGTPSLHIHVDGTMYFTKMEYNYNLEEWEEYIVQDVTNDEEFKTSLNAWFKENNLFQSTQFPFTIGFDGIIFVCDSIDTLIQYLKRRK